MFYIIVINKGQYNQGAVQTLSRAQQKMIKQGIFPPW